MLTHAGSLSVDQSVSHEMATIMADFRSFLSVHSRNRRKLRKKLIEALTEPKNMRNIKRVAGDCDAVCSGSSESSEYTTQIARFRAFIPGQTPGRVTGGDSAAKPQVGSLKFMKLCRQSCR